MINNPSNILKNITISLILSVLLWSILNNFFIELTLTKYFIIEFSIVFMKIISNFIKQKFGLISISDTTKHNTND